MANKEIIIQKMNSLGKSKTPFLFIIDFEMKSPKLFVLDEINPDEIKYNINGITNCYNASKINREIVFKKFPVNYSSYKKIYTNILKEIHLGNSYLLNLTFPTRIETNYTLQEIFLNSNAKYRLYYKNKFVVFSPEIFVKIKEGIISSYPMKGTIDASLENAKEKILSDKKEIAEHNTIVDLIRNDLSIVAKKVRVKKFRYIEKVKTNEKDLLQVSSEMCGNLSANYNSKIGEIIFDLLPAGSICGAPKKKTVDIIKKNEIYKRGYYSGIFGLFDGVNLDSGVMIRFIEKTQNGLIFKSGGGITSLSNPQKEYKEMIDKVYVPFI